MSVKLSSYNRKWGLKFKFDLGSSCLLPFSQRPQQLLNSILRFPLQIALSLRARLALVAGQLFLATRLPRGLAAWARPSSRPDFLHVISLEYLQGLLSPKPGLLSSYKCSYKIESNEIK